VTPAADEREGVTMETRGWSARAGVATWAITPTLCALVGMLCASVVGAQDPAPGWPSERPPRPLQAREVKFPPYQIRTLANGLRVVAVSQHEQPAITMRLLVAAGAVQDPEGKAGLAGLVSKLLDQGSTSRSAQQVADQIDSIGGALGTGSGSDLSFANAVVMKDSFGPALELLVDVVRNPAFSPDEIDRQKEQAISSLQVSANDPDYVASVLFGRLVYGFHPYGLPGSGTAESLGAITRDDLVAFHRRFFVPNNMILGIVGDATSDEAFAAAERVFGTWSRGELPVAVRTEPPMPTRRIVVVDKPDAVQTEIRVGQLAIPRKHPDYLAFDLAVKILGGEGANRLHRVLRSERGLTYGAEAETDAMKQAGDYVAETDTRTETTGEALRLMLDEFGKIQRQRPFERELADAQAYLAGSFPLTIETPNQIATQVLNSVFYELPLEEIGTFRERVQAITPDEILRVSQRYIRPERLSIVLVGNARALVNQLREVGLTEFEVIPIEQLDLMSGTLKRGDRTSARPVGAPARPRGAPQARPDRSARPTPSAPQ
jgi:zinc protease